MDQKTIDRLRELHKATAPTLKHRYDASVVMGIFQVEYYEITHARLPALLDAAERETERADALAGTHVTMLRERKRAERAEAERDKLKAENERFIKWNQDMVAKSAGGGTLDGYRELGQRAAAAETRAERAEALLRRIIGPNVGTDRQAAMREARELLDQSASMCPAFGDRAFALLAEAFNRDRTHGIVSATPIKDAIDAAVPEGFRLDDYDPNYRKKVRVRLWNQRYGLDSVHTYGDGPTVDAAIADAVGKIKMPAPPTAPDD